MLASMVDQSFQCHACFANFTMDVPHALIADVMVDEQKLRDSIAAKWLADLGKCCNEKLKPVVKCPYGCTELDVLYERVLGPKLKTYSTGMRNLCKFVLERSRLSVHPYRRMNLKISLSHRIKIGLL
jgi:hypothetical protein